jgi:ATP phosphoribosyltransferase regulatory subunit
VNATIPAKYCYNGPAFRYQPTDAGLGHPREFRQAGIETFGNGDAIAAEVQTLALMVEAVQVAGLDRRQLVVRFGDLELVRALLDAIEMPERWRERLQANFWQPSAFRAELKRLTEGAAHHVRGLEPSLVAALTDANPADAEGIVGAHLDLKAIETFGARRVSEIAHNALGLIADSRATPLSAATASVIESYVAIRAPSLQAATQITALTRSAGIDLSASLARFEARLAAITASGLDLNDALFSGNFGRSLEYYTGFVFEISAPGLPQYSPIAGGGRYDSLMHIAGSPNDVPAVGAAIHTERLLAAIEGTAA